MSHGFCKPAIDRAVGGVALSWGTRLMIWLVALMVPVLGVPLFVWAYGRHLSHLTGPWIAKGTAGHD